METLQAGPEPSLRQSKTALLEAAQAAIHDQKARSDAPTRPFLAASPGRNVFRGLLVILTLASGTVLIVQPAWLVTPKPAPETPAIQAASATLVLVDAVSRIKSFAEATGRLPARLKEAGVVNPAISLRPIEGTEFEVSLAAAGATMSLKSTDALKPLVAGAIKTLQGRS